MLTRSLIMTKYPDLREGTTVYDRDGKQLGKITNLFENYFIIEKGFFFPLDFSVRYDEIKEMRDGDLYLELGKEHLQEWTNKNYAGWSEVDNINAGRSTAKPLPEFRDRYANLTSQETKVPVMEEELEATKKLRQAGEVKLRKVVHTEFKHFTVPVIKEEVRVERTPVREGEPAAHRTGEPAFKETTINVPVMEEEVTVSKKPVIKEEVRVSKERRTEEREVAGEIRKEDVEIQKEGDLKKRKAG